MYVGMCLCMHVCIYDGRHVGYCTYVCLHVYKGVCIYLHMYVYNNSQMLCNVTELH